MALAGILQFLATRVEMANGQTHNHDSTIPIKGPGALPERVASMPAKPKTVPLTFRAPVEMHDRLRKLAYDTRVPIQKVIEDAVSAIKIPKAS